MSENKADDWNVDDMFPLGTWQQELRKIPVPNRDLCVVLYNEEEVRMCWYYADLAIVRNKSNPTIWIGEESGIRVNPFDVKVSPDGKYLFCCAEAYNKQINKKYSFAYPFFVINLDEKKACVIHHKNASHYEIIVERGGIFRLNLKYPESAKGFPDRDGERIPINDLDWEPLDTMRYHYEKYALSGQVEPYRETIGTWIFDKFWSFLARISLTNMKWRFESEYYNKFVYKFVAAAVLKIQIYVTTRKNRS